MVLGVLAVQPAAVAEDGAVAEPPSPAADTPPFQPGDISIGEPLQLPLNAAETVVPAPVPAPVSGAVDVAPGSSRQQPFRDPVAAEGLRGDSAGGGPAARGTGWLGFSVDDSIVTGRLVIVDVAEKGPAAAAGVRRQDVLLAIDGEQLHTADQLAAALAAITPGQEVKAALGRPDRIDEVVLLAAARPPEAVARDWQAASRAEPSRQPARAPAASAFSAVDSPLPAAPPPAAPLPPPSASAPVDFMNRGIGTAAAPADLPGPQAAVLPRGRTALGVRTLPVDPGVQARFRLSEPAGALVIGVVHDLPASKAGVPPGSVIVALDNRPVRSPTDLTALVTNSPIDKPVLLQYVLPGGEARRAEVSLQSLELPLERVLVGPATPATTTPPTLLQPATARRIANRTEDPRPAATQAATASDPAAPIRAEVRFLRARLEALEERLERMR